MSSLKLKTPGGGSVSFNATDTANDVTLTVPASNASVLTDSSNIPAANLTGSLPAGMGGKVLQVIYGESSAVTSWAAGSTWKDFGVSATITPSSTSSKILVMTDINYGFSIGGVAHSMRLLRNSTNIYAGASTGFVQGFQALEGSISGRQYEMQKVIATTVDSPSSTSALTYKVQHYQHVSTGTVYMNRTDNNQANLHAQTRSSITLMEIAG